MTTSLSTAALKSARTFQLLEDLSTIDPHERITQDKLMGIAINQCVMVNIRVVEVSAAKVQLKKK